MVPFPSKSYILQFKRHQIKKQNPDHQLMETEGEETNLIICCTTEREKSRFPTARALWSQVHRCRKKSELGFWLGEQTKYYWIETSCRGWGWRGRRTWSWWAVMLPERLESTRSNHSRRVTALSITVSDEKLDEINNKDKSIKSSWLLIVKPIAHYKLLVIYKRSKLFFV